MAAKHLNSLITIVTLSWLGGAEATHPFWVQEVTGSIWGSRKGFYDRIFVLLLMRFYFFAQNTLFVTQFCNLICSVNLYIKLNILKDLCI